MTKNELKILENLKKEIEEKEDFSLYLMAFCRKHKFEMEAAALEYRGDAYRQC